MRYLIPVYFLFIILALSCQSKVKEATASGGTKDSLGIKAKENVDDEGYTIDEEYYKVDPADSAYHAFRIEIATPPYGLGKIEELIKKIEFVTDDNYEEIAAMNDSAYTPLTFREKFTYHMIHPESYSQICDYIPPPKKASEKVFAYLPELFSEYNWSERQRKFVKDNRDSVMFLIKESALRSKRIKLNYKQAIVEANATEMIPFLIEIYNTDSKDGDILTVLLRLMREGKYKPFVLSPLHKKLYNNEENFDSYIDLTDETRDLIIKWANDFYNESQN